MLFHKHPQWKVKKVQTYPKEFKVYPSAMPSYWERNDAEFYFENEIEAELNALKRNEEYENNP